jgi:Cdc6-like AAA superfamily ATPase
VNIPLSRPIRGPMDGSVFDEPQSDRSHDLLNMDVQAQALAEYIRQYDNKLPFTVGIFGQWGEGKTTLVRFLHRHLSSSGGSPSPQPLEFIPFSAWPYTTSEKLWRALILEIAQVLYGRKKPAWNIASENAASQAPLRQKQPEPSGLLSVLTGFLASDGLVLARRPGERDEYQGLLDEMDNISYGAIGKRSGHLPLDQEAIMAAIVKGAVAVLSSVSPLVAGLRSLLGIEPKIDVARVVQQETKGINEAARETVEALPKFQKLFRKMLHDKAAGKLVVVFIDDLDRCQPDVALDILESIRIALSEVECVFVIAVDETLIAQGLRLRYKELFASDPSPGAFSTKGQEYLEKVIQFRVRVPPRTPRQAQRFIAAQFPQWMPAGDLIETVVGNNPRRLKQYCQRLSFQKMVLPRSNYEVEKETPRQA